MKSRFAGIAGILALLLLEVRAVPTAEACGTKLSIKTSAPRKAVARSQNASRVLLVGQPPRRLQKDLTAAGHKVDTVPRSDAAQNNKYAIVVVDSKEQESDARARFKDSVVLVRSGDTGTDIKTLEARLARPVVGAPRDGDLVGAKDKRKPIAAGPAVATAKPIGAKAPTETADTPPPAPAVAVAPKPAQPETPPPRPVPEKPAQEAPPEKVAVATPRAETPRKAVSSAKLRQEVFFSLGSARVPGASRSIAKAARWLNDNPEARVTVEGHADPSGTPEGNMTLSQARADAVKDELVQAGIDASRIEVNAYGDTQLKYGARDGRNRRVAIQATK